MFVKCTRPGCKRAEGWDYQGTKRSTKDCPAYVTCPSCRRNVKLPVEELQQ